MWIATTSTHSLTPPQKMMSKEKPHDGRGRGVCTSGVTVSRLYGGFLLLRGEKLKDFTTDDFGVLCWCVVVKKLYSKHIGNKLRVRNCDHMPRIHLLAAHPPCFGFGVIKERHKCLSYDTHCFAFCLCGDGKLQELHLGGEVRRMHPHHDRKPTRVELLWGYRLFGHQLSF